MFKRLSWLLAIALACSSFAFAALASDPSPAAAGGAAEKPNLLDVNFFGALWVVVIFVVLVAVLYPTAWKNVLAGLKARETRIRTDIAEAEAARTKAEATLREYNAQLATAENRVRDMINSASAEAQKIAAQIRTQGEQEAQASKERATREIEAAKKQALAEIYEQTAVLSTSIAEKILRRNLNPDDQRDLVNSSLEQFQAINKN